MESTISEQREPDQWVLAVVETAMRKRYLITDCPDCRGPRIHSKQRNGSRCVGCVRRWETSVIRSTRTCDRCRKPITRQWGQSTRCQQCRREVARVKKAAYNRTAYRRKQAERV